MLEPRVLSSGVSQISEACLLQTSQPLKDFQVQECGLPSLVLACSPNRIVNDFSLVVWLLDLDTRKTKGAYETRSCAPDLRPILGSHRLLRECTFEIGYEIGESSFLL